MRISPMTKSIPTIAAAVLMTAIATPVFAQAAIQEPGAYAFYHPNADVLGSRPAYRSFDSTNAYLADSGLVRETQRIRPPASRHHRRGQ
jgi:hypothetical protein